MISKLQRSLLSSFQIDKIWSWLPITLILLLATILYLYQLGTEPLWTDEFYSIRDAEAFNILDPGVRPLYFILLKFWMNFGNSDAWLRSLSVIFGIGNVFLTYQVGRRTAGELTGIISAFLLTLSPIFIFHAQEIRMYSMSTFIGLAGTLILIKTLENISLKMLIIWAILRMLTTLTSPLNILLLLPDLLIIAWEYRKQRRLLLFIGICLLSVGILIIPSATTMLDAAPKFFGDWVANLPPMNLKILLSTLEVFTVNPPGSSEMGALLSTFFRLYTILLLGLMGVALFHIIKNRIQPLLWIVAWAFLPSLPILFMSYAFANIWFPRYLLFVAPYLLILIAVGFLQIFHRWRYIAAIIGICYLMAVSFVLTHYYTTSERTNWPLINQVITENEKLGDVILFSRAPTNLQTPNALTRYYQGQLPIELQVDLCEKTVSQTPAISKSETVKITPLSNLLSAYSRFWLVCEQFNQQDFDTFIYNKFTIEKRQTFPNKIKPVELFLLVPQSTENSSKLTPPLKPSNSNSPEKT